MRNAKCKKCLKGEPLSYVRILIHTPILEPCQVLMLQYRTNDWQLPGTAIEGTDSAHQAAALCIEEETGLAAPPADLRPLRAERINVAGHGALEGMLFGYTYPGALEPPLGPTSDKEDMQLMWFAPKDLDGVEIAGPTEARLMQLAPFRAYLQARKKRKAAVQGATTHSDAKAMKTVV